MHLCRAVLAYIMALALVGGLSVAPAWAGVVGHDSNPVTYGPTSLPWPGGAQFSFPQWDPTLYPGQQLDSIELSLYGQLAGAQGWVLTVGSGIDISMMTTATLTLDSPGGGVVVVAIPTQTDQWLNQNPASASATLTNSDSQSGFVGASHFAFFIGSGNVVTPLTGIDSHVDTATGGGGTIITFIHNPQALAKGHIEYTYSDIPEPGTMALVGFGLLGLMCLARRRRSA